MREIYTKNKKLIFISYIILLFILSVVITLRVYPFIGLADGFIRWRLALSFIQKGQREFNVMSPLIPFLQYICYRVSKEYSLFTMFQVYFYYLAIFLFGYWLTDKKLIISIILNLGLICIPSIGIFPTLLTDSSLCFCFIVCFILITYKILSNKENDKRRNLIYSALFGISSFFMILLRANTLSILFGVSIIILYYIIFKKKKLITPIIYGIVSIFIVSLINVDFHGQKLHTECYGMLWEIVGMVSEDKNNELKDIRFELESFGDVEKAISQYNSDYCNSMIWDSDCAFSSEEIANSNNAKKVYNIYFKVMLKHTKIFVNYKKKVAFRSLGISEPLLDASRGIHGIDDHTREYGAIDSLGSNMTRQKWIECTNNYKMIMMRPIFLFIVVAILLIILKIIVRNKINRKILFSYVISIFYYGAFCLNTQAYEVRYYYPALLILIICVFIVIYEIYENIKGIIKNKVY